MSAWTCRSTDGKAVAKIVPPRPRIPCWKGLGANSEEKRQPRTECGIVSAQTSALIGAGASFATAT